MTNWEKLFGTPERTVRTIIDGCCCDCYACSMPIDCPCFGEYRVLDDDAEKLLVWLESEVRDD